MAIEGITIFLIRKITFENSIILNICSIISPGLLEETGRYIVLRYLFSKDQQKNISISYGIGHGGIESILIGFTVLSNLLVKDTLIKNGLLKENITFFVFFDECN